MDDRGPAFDGAVLCGGASRRMGRDKALIRVGESTMVENVAAALAEAGAVAVVAVGRPPGALAELGLASVPDDDPGRGPVGGIVTALGWTSRPVVMVVGCDLVAPSPSAMAATVAAVGRHPDADVAVPHLAGRPQWVHAAWRRSAGPALAAALAAGHRSVGETIEVAGLAVVDVPGVDATALGDADTPGDLSP